MTVFDRFNITVGAIAGLCGAAMALSPDVAATPLKTGGYACIQGQSGEVGAPAAGGPLAGGPVAGGPVAGGAGAAGAPAAGGPAAGGPAPAATVCTSSAPLTDM
jgi:hypothetical protein